MLRGQRRVSRRVSALTYALAIGLVVAGCSSTGPHASKTPGNSPHSWLAGTDAPTLEPTVAAIELPTEEATLEPTEEPSPTEEPTPTPEPTPEITAWPVPSDAAVIAVCSGKVLPGAAKYAGKTHPAMFVQQTAWDDKTLEVDPHGAFFISEVAPQLVVCYTKAAARVGSCGTYKRSGDGKIGEVVRWRQTETVKAVFAATGKVLATKTFTGATPSCNGTIYDWENSTPPWFIYGSSPSGALVYIHNTYAIYIP